MNGVMTIIERHKIVPVVTLQRLDAVANVFGALTEGGLPVAEICFRTDCAEDAVGIARAKFPQMLIGAGTVIGREQCSRALRAGAQFIVSPGLSEEVAAVCGECGVPCLPGAVTSTEIMRALALGITHLKFFPAESCGGMATIKALSAAFPQVRFLPTGGVNAENLKEYLAHPSVFACGGSWMVQGTYDEIVCKTRAAVAAAKGE